MRRVATGIICAATLSACATTATPNPAATTSTPPQPAATTTTPAAPTTPSTQPPVLATLTRTTSLEDQPRRPPLPPAPPAGTLGRAGLAGTWDALLLIPQGTNGYVHCDHNVVKDVATWRAELSYVISSTPRDPGIAPWPELGQPDNSVTISIIRSIRKGEGRWWTEVRVAVKDNATITGFTDTSGIYSPTERPRATYSPDRRQVRMATVIPLTSDRALETPDDYGGWSQVTASIRCPNPMPLPTWAR